MPFPNYAGKHEHEELISPADVHRWRVERGLLPEGPVPEAVVLTYQRRLFEALCEREDTRPLARNDFPFDCVVTLDRTDGRVGVAGGFGIGAPVATIVLEELIALGARRFCSIGTAGGLQPDLEPGAVVLCDGAVRDEGVSHHYAPADRDARPDATLTEALAAALDARSLPHRRGRAWTIDAPYRETKAEARHYRDEGALCVEMEAAALFTVAAHRGVPLASAFCISDSLADAEWNPHFDAPDLAGNLWSLLRGAIRTLSDGAAGEPPSRAAVEAPS